MAKSQVVILSGQTLFAQGIASRLKQYPQKVDVLILDPEEAQIVEQTREARPAAVIVDASEPNQETFYSLWMLLTTIPNLKVIRLHLEHSDIQIVTSTHLNASDVRDLIELLD
ncbi:MAG: hypothetical protein R3335_00880 [Anaerolineales bacterium]|nr:hypothetical protein [Anaerolineales bacterium]